MALVWREQMSVGNTLIDTEHRYLLDQINAVELALNSEDNHDILVETLDHLAEYTQTHFDHEEQIQLKIKFPLHEEHKIKHQEIMTELYSIKQKLDEILGTDEEENDSNPDDEVTDDELNMLLDDDDSQRSANKSDLAPLVVLLRNWLVDHIIGSDMKMKPYLKKLPPDYRAPL